METKNVATSPTLKDLRKLKSITQSDLALAVGVQREIISNWENGKRKPTEPQLARLRSFFGCDEICLVSNKEEIDIYSADAEESFDAKKFGAVLQRVRKQNGLTTTEMAERLHLSRSTLSQWETGRHAPPIDVFKEICVVLNISACELLGLIPYEDNSLAFDLLLAFSRLNRDGKEESYKRVLELLEISRYRNGEVEGAEEI